MRKVFFLIRITNFTQKCFSVGTRTQTKYIWIQKNVLLKNTITLQKNFEYTDKKQYLKLTAQSLFKNS